METTRERILGQARGLLREGGKATVGQIALAAGVSRTSFYRAFDSRDALLEALDVAPEPGARQRLLDAALQMVGAHGLSALSMDELADRAQVSRATLYRVFPGKSALFTALVNTYSPLEPVIGVLTAMHDQPPELVMPEIARTVYRTTYGRGADRTGMLRALFFEVSGLAPDTEEAARLVIARVVGGLMFYLTAQTSEGRLRAMHPMLALQSFIGPILFHVITRAAAERVLGLDIEGEEAVTELAETWLRAMKP
jgi:AcrR family transcriptional regulator